MQQSSRNKSLLSRIGAGFAFALCFGLFTFPALAREAAMETAVWHDCSPAYLLTMTDPPEFLAPAPSFEEEQEDFNKTTVIPFIGSDQALTLLPIPERPAIAASDAAPLERPEVTAGVKVDLGGVNFNLGYTLPSSQVDEFIQPLGVQLEPGADSKRFSLGVKIPF